MLSIIPSRLLVEIKIIILYSYIPGAILHGRSARRCLKYVMLPEYYYLAHNGSLGG